jgi:hypothetical protein
VKNIQPTIDRRLAKQVAVAGKVFRYGTQSLNASHALGSLSLSLTHTHVHMHAHIGIYGLTQRNH